MTLTPKPLTFPPSTHAKLSPRTYLTAHLQASATSSHDRPSTTSPQTDPPTRPSSRHPTTSRVPHIHTNNLTHTHGSAVVRLGDTAVVCGIQGSVLLASSIPASLSYGTSSSPSSNDDEQQQQQESHAQKPNRSSSSSRTRTQQRQTIAQLNLLIPHVDLNTGCAPEYLPAGGGGGGAPGVVAQGVVQRVVSALHNADVVALDKLAIYSRDGGKEVTSASPSISSSDSDSDEDVDMDGGGGGVALPDQARQPGSAAGGGGGPNEGGHGEVKAFYTLNLYVYVLSLDHGANGLFDAVWMAVVAALATTRLPQIYYDDSTEGISVDWDSPRRKVCRQGGWPVASSFGVFRMRRDGLGGADKGEKGEEGEGSVVLADPDAFEEGLCEEVVTLLVREDEGQLRVLGMEKQGGGVVGVGEMRQLVGLAGERCKTVNEVLEKECRE